MSFFYTKEHEWFKVDDDVVVVGITDYAQELLGALVFIELPKINSNVKKGKSVAVVESYKTSSDVFSPVDGVVLEVNGLLGEKPELINSSPYVDGWLCKIKLSEVKINIKDYMNEKEYADFIATLD